MATEPQKPTKPELERQAEIILHARMESLILRRVLLNKGILTEDDIAQAYLEVDRESREAIAALLRPPAGGVQ